MRVRVANLSLGSVQAAVNEMCDTITSLVMSRSAGFTPEDTEDISKPGKGRVGYNRATGKLARFDGSTWTDL